jgi:hypothetical protein
MIEQNEVIIDACHFCQQNFIQHPAVNFNAMLRKLLVIITVDFDATGQLFVLYLSFVKYLRKKWEFSKALHPLYIHFKKTYDFSRRACCIIFFFEFGFPMKLVRLIKCV